MSARRGLQPRRFLFWSHLVAGVVAGFLILFFAATGSVLSFERQIVAHADRGYRVAPGGARLPLAAFLTHAPVPVQSVTVYADPSMSVALATAHGVMYFGDPYTGRISGPASPRTRAFFNAVTSLHRWFGLEERHRTAASLAKGLAVWVFVYLLLSGVVLWWPARISRAALRLRILPRLGLRARPQLVNWHLVAGAWVSLPLLAIALTGLIMAFPWVNAALFRLAGTAAPPQGEHRGADGAGQGQHPSHGSTANPQLNAGLQAAEAAVAGWRSISVRFPQTGHGLLLTADRSNGGHPDAQVQVLYARGRDGQTHLRVTPFRAQERGRRWRAWVRFLHTGEAAGLWGEAVGCLAALGACVLVVTGLWLAVLRLSRRIAKGAAPARGVAASEPQTADRAVL